MTITILRSSSTTTTTTSREMWADSNLIMKKEKQKNRVDCVI